MKCEIKKCVRDAEYLIGTASVPVCKEHKDSWLAQFKDPERRKKAAKNIVFPASVIR